MRDCLHWIRAPITVDGDHPLYVDKKVADLLGEKIEPTEEKASDNGKDDLAKTGTIASVLIATVAFAAAFTVPGGFIADDHPGAGTAILATRFAFRIHGFRHNGVRLLHRSNLLPHVWLCKRNPAQASFMVQLIGFWVGAGGSAVYDRRVCFRVSARTGQRQPFFHCFRIRGIFSCSACLLPRHLDSHAPWAGEDGMAASRVERSC